MGSQTQFGMPDPMMGMGSGMGVNPLVAAIQAAMQRPPMSPVLPQVASLSARPPDPLGNMNQPPAALGFGATGRGISPLVTESLARETGLAEGYPVIPVNFPRPTNIAPYLGGGTPVAQMRALGIPRRFREGSDT